MWIVSDGPDSKPMFHKPNVGFVPANLLSNVGKNSPMGTQIAVLLYMKGLQVRLACVGQ